MKKLLLLAPTLLILQGCSSPKAVLACTSTVLGVDVSQNPANQMYHAKFGYARSEIAYVPGRTNDLSQVADVIMEIRLQNIFSGGGVYQRLAVGPNAVSQPGAALMFAKDPQGNISPDAVRSITAPKSVAH